MRWNRTSRRAATLLLITTVIAAFVLRSVDRRDTADGPVVIEPAASALALRPHWHQGDRQSYRLAIRSRVILDVRDGSSTTEFEQRLTGTLHLHVLQSNLQGALTALQLEAASLVRERERDADVDRRLGKPFVARWTVEGRLMALTASVALDRNELAVLEEALRCFQLVAPDDCHERWETSEVCGTGGYRARYQRLTEDSIEKSKVGFETTPQATRVQVVSSSALFGLRPDTSWIDSCELNEVLELDAAGTAVRSETHASLTRNETHATAPEVFADDFRLEVDSHDRGFVERIGVPVSAPLALNAELRELYAAWLDQLDRGSGTDIAAIAALQALFEACPEAALLVPDSLLSGAHTKRARGTLLHALERAGTTAAQAALEHVATDMRHAHDDRIGALVAIGGVAEANGNTIAMLWRLAAERTASGGIELANTASLTLGCIGNTLRVIEPQTYAGLRDNLVQALHGAADDSERAVYLKSLGNLADPDLTEGIGTYLSADDARVRVAAASALATVDDDRVGEILATALATETHPRVRRALALSLAARPRTDDGTMQLAEQLVACERDETVRDALVRYLGSHLPAHPETAKALNELLRTERSDRIRRYIAERLLELDAVPER